MILFLDANIVLFGLTGHAAMKSHIAAELARYTGPDVVIAVSLLSRLECFVRAIRDKDAPNLKRLHDFFNNPRLRIIALTPSVIDGAANMRARYGLKTPDAIQLSCAIECNAAVFITADKGFKRCSELTLNIIDITGF